MISLIRRVIYVFLFYPILTRPPRSFYFRNTKTGMDVEVHAGLLGKPFWGCVLGPENITELDMAAVAVF